MAVPDYLDCELYVMSEARARLSGGGQEAEGDTRLGDELATELDRAESEHDFQRYGRSLFEALFVESGKLLAGYRALRTACGRDRKLRLRLFIAANPEAARLHRYHWEYLYDPVERFALGRSQKTALSRYLAVDREAPAAVSGKPRLLVVLAAPRDLEDEGLARLEREEMRDIVETSLRPLRERLDCRYLEGPATRAKIRDQLVGFKPHVLLFQGHGLLGDEAGLALEDKTGCYQPIDESTFAEMLDDASHLRLVTLVACHSGELSSEDPYSGLAPSLVARGVPAVVAMRRQIDLETAESFLQCFFKNLERSGRLDAAVNEARTQLHLENPDGREWGTPALFMRLKDGRIWEDTPSLHAGQPASRGPSAEAEVDWANLLDLMQARRLLPILGPGVLDDLLPSQEEIARAWAHEFSFPGNGSDRGRLPQVARFVETQKRKGFPHDRLIQDLLASLLERLPEERRPDLETAPLSEAIEMFGRSYFPERRDEPHRILAELPIPYYVTTNVDSFLTAALQWVPGQKKPLRTRCRWRERIAADIPVKGYQDVVGSEESPLVFHLYGNDEEATSVVLTEDDHLAFLRAITARFDLCVPAELHKALSESMLLFLGFRVEDLGCRVLFHGLVTRLRDQRGRAAVVQLPAEDQKNREALRHFVETCCGDVDIKVHWVTPAEFLAELRDRWRAGDG